MQKRTGVQQEPEVLQGIVANRSSTEARRTAESRSLTESRGLTGDRSSNETVARQETDSTGGRQEYRQREKTDRGQETGTDRERVRYRNQTSKTLYNRQLCDLGREEEQSRMTGREEGTYRTGTACHCCARTLCRA